MKRKRIGFRMLLREKQRGQESELKTQRQRINKSRMIEQLLILRE
jgi:hypothetical protein